VLGILADLDALFADRGGRPHWGKLYDAPAESVAARYPRFGEFAALVDDVDPSGTFRNRTLDALLTSS
jgi:alditol oxidase